MGICGYFSENSSLYSFGKSNHGKAFSWVFPRLLTPEKKRVKFCISPENIKTLTIFCSGSRRVDRCPKRLFLLLDMVYSKGYYIMIDVGEKILGKNLYGKIPDHRQGTNTLITMKLEQTSAFKLEQIETPRSDI